MKTPQTEPPAPEEHVIKLVAKDKHLSVRKLSEIIGVTQTRLDKMIQRNSPVTYEVAQKIKAVYPDLYDKYLADTQEHSDTEIKQGKSKEVIPLGKHRPLRLKPEEYAEAFGDWQGLPMYNTPVTASFVETYRDDKLYKPQYYLHDPRFRDCDFGAIITGDSMHSEIRHGDFIACKEITDRRFIVYGDIYYVVATNGLETCKYLNADKANPDNYMLIAKNDHISPAPIPKDMILRLYKVRGIIRGY